MSSPPPPPPPRPPALNKSPTPNPGSLTHLLQVPTSRSFSAPSSPTAVDSDPVIASLQEELAGLKDELKNLAKSPSTKQACEGIIKFMTNEADQNREPFARPLDVNSRWASSSSGCCTIA